MSRLTATSRIGCTSQNFRMNSEPITITEQIEVATRTARLREFLALEFSGTHKAALKGGAETLVELERSAEVCRAIVETLKAQPQ